SKVESGGKDYLILMSHLVPAFSSYSRSPLEHGPCQFARRICSQTKRSCTRFILNQLRVIISADHFSAAPLVRFLFSQRQSDLHPQSFVLSAPLGNIRPK